jgi:hypothetical protein
LFLGFLVVLQWLNKTKIQKNKTPRNQKTKKIQNDKTQLSANIPPLGCAILFFFFFGLFVFCFCFFGLLFFWFVVFWFVVGFLKG